MNEHESLLFIENVSNEAVAIFTSCEQKRWRTRFNRYIIQWRNPTVPHETFKKVVEEVQRKVHLLDQRYAYAKVVVNAW